MASINWQIYDHYGYALLAVLGTFAAVAAIYRLMSHSALAPWVRSLRGVVPPFINIIGVLFGLTLAFLANDTWSAHDRAMNAVHKEADAIRSLFVLADTLDNPVRQRLQQALGEYAKASIAEWEALAQRKVSPEVSRQADAFLGMLSGREVTRAAGDSLQALMLRKAMEIRDQRELRIGLSQTHVNPLKWLGMAFLGFVTLLSVAVVHGDNARAAFVAILLFALTAAPTAAIVLVQGNPFQQPLAVSPAPIQAVLGR